MSYTRDRDEFIARVMTMAGGTRTPSTSHHVIHVARKLMPLNLERLQPDGRKDVRACPECRTQAALRATVRDYLSQYQAVFSGDPRGYVVRLAPAAATTADIDAGRVPLVCIPGRE